MSVDFPSNIKDRIIERHGDIVSTVYFPNFKNSLVNFIRQYGNLYHGTLRQDFFINRYKSEKINFISSLIQATDSIEKYQPIWFKQHLIRLAISGTWSWPCLCNEISNKLDWNNGQGRFFASGMTQEDPWNNLKLLILQNKNSPADKFLNSAKLINNDEELHQVLGINCPENYNFPPAIELFFKHENNHLTLGGLYDGNTAHHKDAGKDYFEDLLNWKKRYGPRPRLHVYTDWPEQLIDSGQVWDYIHAGPSGSDKVRETFLYNYHNDPKYGNDHVLYVYNSRAIDLSDLLAWVGLTYSGYIGTNWDFALIRPDREYVTTRFNFSYIY